MMKAVILCGGQGLRMKGCFGNTPKPLVEVQGKPILEHIIHHYCLYGVSEFVLLVGANEQAFRQFADRYKGSSVLIKVLQTGEDTPTGGRLAIASHLFKNEKNILVTYGDGIANLNVDALVDQHISSGKGVTLTAVQPRLPFGLLDVDDSASVISFIEKPMMPQLINGGFFVISTEVLKKLDLDSDFETDVLPSLVDKGELGAYFHKGFWQSMDTYKDVVRLNSMELPPL